MAISKVPVVAGTKTLTRGSIVSGNASGEPAALAIGSNGQVLKSDGTDAVWGTDAGGAALTGSTNNTVVTVTGANAIQGEADLTFDGTNLDLPDNKKIRLGTGNDLEVYHDANNSYLKNNINSLISLSAGHYWRNVADTSNSGMCIVSSNVGIGEETPLGKLHVKTGDSGASADAGADEVVVEGSANSGISILSGASSEGSIKFGDSGDNNIGMLQYHHSNNSMQIYTNNTERIRFLSDGQVQISGGSGRASTLQVCDGLGGGYEAISTMTAQSGNATQIAFINPNGTVGYINTNGSGTSYLTSSDYRLKDNVTDLTGAITRIKTLKPKRFNFKSTPDETVDGFLAHEVSSIVPEAISGEKDAVEKYRNADEIPEGSSIGDNKLDENGDTIIDPQGIDQSKLVPLLVAAVQELTAKVEALENA